MQPLAVIVLLDERRDIAAQIIKILIRASVVSSRFSVFMKLSQLALS